MARHLHVVGDGRLPRHKRRETEAGITRAIELVAAAIAGALAPMLHAPLPGLRPPGARGRARRRSGPDLA